MPAWRNTPGNRETNWQTESNPFLSPDQLISTRLDDLPSCYCDYQVIVFIIESVNAITLKLCTSSEVDWSEVHGSSFLLQNYCWRVGGPGHLSSGSAGALPHRMKNEDERNQIISSDPTSQPDQFLTCVKIGDKFCINLFIKFEENKREKTLRDFYHIFGRVKLFSKRIFLK